MGIMPMASVLNGHAMGEKDDFSILNDWLFLVREEPGVLARATEVGLEVDTWDRPGIGRTIKGRNVIVVLSQIGDDRQAEFEAYNVIKAAGAAIVKVWKPFSLGGDKTRTLKELATRYDLAGLLWADRPWEYAPWTDAPHKRPTWPCTDLGNAERMASRYSPVLRYCQPWKKWLVWNGQRWEPDCMGKVNAMAKATMRKILGEASGEPDKEERKRLAAWAIRCESSSKIESMLKLAWSEERVPIMPGDLDPDHWLLNCENGTINLRTGELNSHDRGDMITRMAPVEFDMDAKCPIWEQAVQKIFAGCEPVISFVRRLCGIALTGDVTEQILPIFYGSGANGKSTVLATILDILGSDYAIMAPPGLLFQRHGDNHPTERACLFGKRLVVDMESAEGARLNEPLVKQLTGSDRIEARRMREDFWSFIPTHKIIMGTNHRPEIKETKNAIWRRVKLVPFKVEIPEMEQILDLPARLKVEYPGILAWCVRGCLDWQDGGLRTPKEVKDATAEYRADQDTLGCFFEELCITNPSAAARSSQLYERYSKFTEGSGEKPMNQKSFGVAMIERGFERYTNNGTWYRGIGLRSEHSDDWTQRD